MPETITVLPRTAPFRSGRRPLNPAALYAAKALAAPRPGHRRAAAAANRLPLNVTCAERAPGLEALGAPRSPNEGGLTR